MPFRLDMLPETGIEPVDRVLGLVGAMYVLFTCAQAFVPKDAPVARLLATFTADLRGVLFAAGQAQNTPASDKQDGHRKTKAKKKSA